METETVLTSFQEGFDNEMRTTLSVFLFRVACSPNHPPACSCEAVGGSREESKVVLPSVCEVHFPESLESESKLQFCR